MNIIILYMQYQHGMEKKQLFKKKMVYARNILTNVHMSHLKCTNDSSVRTFRVYTVLKTIQQKVNESTIIP